MADELARQRQEAAVGTRGEGVQLRDDRGTKTLAELFDGRSQLLVYHFMFGPGYEAACPVCSSSAAAVNGVLPHLHARDVTMLYVSRAPLEKLEAYKGRMGWAFPWVSSADSDFNFDYGISYTDERCASRWDRCEGEPPPVLRQMAAATGPTWPDTSRKDPA